MHHSTLLLPSPHSCPFSLLPSHQAHLPSPHFPSTLPTPPPLSSSSHRRRRPLPSHCVLRLAVAGVAAASVEEREKQGSGFVEVGYISKAHGLDGEVRVVPSTDFPELRFSKPGRRWLRKRVSGKECVSEVELIEGRGHPGQKTWIVSLGGIDTVDKAKQIVGSTLLVREEDRPDLEEGEFYTSDLVGMRVILKETGEVVGTVANVFNYGASDLLQVILNPDKERHDDSKSEAGASGPLAWIPFVEAIVPEVDMDRREMMITPPKGLLELNLRNDTRSKKERRQLEWKERKKLQHRLIAAKKKLCEMGQNHLLEGLRFGEKAQKSFLARQIVEINLKLFQHALQSCNTVIDRFNMADLIKINATILMKNTLKISGKCLTTCASEEKNDTNYEFHREGLSLLMKSKAAIIVVTNCEGSLLVDSEVDSTGRPEDKHLQVQELFLGCKRILKVEDQDVSVPFILVSPAHEIQLFEEVLLNNDYFGFDRQKVWILEGQKLPIVGTSSDSNKILLKSSWEILQAPTGSGGVFSVLSSHKVLDHLNEMGVEYVQICSLDETSAIANPFYFGFVKSRRADIGIKVSESKKEDHEFDMIFSMRHLNKICKQPDQLQFSAVPEQRVHVKQVEAGGWVEVHPEGAPNSCRLNCSIYTTLNNCSHDCMCIMHVSQ